MANSSARNLKKKSKKDSIELIESVIKILEHDYLDSFYLPDIKKVLGICKAIRAGKFDTVVRGHFGSFKYPARRINKALAKVDTMNNKGGYNQKWYNDENLRITDSLIDLSKYSDKIFEKYQAANRDASIDALLK